MNWERTSGANNKPRKQIFDMQELLAHDIGNIKEKSKVMVNSYQYVNVKIRMNEE